MYSAEAWVGASVAGVTRPVQSAENLHAPYLHYRGREHFPVEWIQVGYYAQLEGAGRRRVRCAWTHRMNVAENTVLIKVPRGCLAAPGGSERASTFTEYWVAPE